MNRAWGWFSGLGLWLRLIIGVVAAALIIFAAMRLPGAIKYMIFGDTGAKREHANTVVAQQQGEATKEIGAAAQNEVVRTYEHDVQIDHIVREGQDAVAKADHGQQMDPDIDNAVAAGLCRVHDSLCRGPHK
jgi:Sec-independent protein translocase protein TatA